MNKNNKIKIAIQIVVVIVILAVFVGGAFISYGLHTEGSANNDAPSAVYKCDVQNITLNTKVIVYKDNEEIGTISGKVLRYITDPLQMKNTNGEVKAYASDSYNVINQDDHAIVADGEYQFTMCGQWSFVGNKYVIANEKYETIGTVKFDYFNTNGQLLNKNGEMVAEFVSKPFMNDYTVKIYDGNEFNENALLLMFASYYSDQKADTASSSSHNS